MNDARKPAGSKKMREQGETRGVTTPDTDSAINEEVDVKRLLHELQVHQVELEMQNDELRQVIAERNEMEGLLGTYRDLYEFAPAGYFNLDCSGIIRAVNQTGARLVGVEQTLLINSRFDAFVSAETRPLFHNFLEKVFLGDVKEMCEVALVRQDHAQLIVQIEAVSTASGKDCRAIVIDITRRKQTENELAKTTLKLEALMAAVPVGISYSDDISCQNITGNPAVLQQFNVSSGDNLSASALDRDAPGRKVEFYLDGRLISDAELPLQRAVAENRVIPPLELKVLMPDGRQWFAEASGAPVLDAEGNVVGGIAVTEDITARKLAEQLLRENEERLRLVLKASSIGTFEFDLQSGETQWNPTMYELLGIQSEDIQPSPEIFFRYVHPDDGATLLKHWEQALHEGKLDAEFRIIRADGQERWLAGKGEFVFEDNVAVTVRNSHRSALRFLGINYDITSRKLVEQSLQQSKDEWERTFDSVPDLIAILDNQHRIVRVNQAMADQLNLKPSQCAGLSCYKAIHGTNIPPSFCPLNRSLTDLEDHESRVDETVFGGTFLVSITPLFNGDGDMYASVHVARDITRLSQMEKELRDKEERLRLLGDNLPYSAVYQNTQETDGSVRFLYISAGIENLNGISVQALLQDAGELYRQIPPEYLAQLQDAEAKSARELSDFDMEVPMLRPDGELRWMQLHSRPRLMPDGRVIWDGVQTDITAKKQTDDLLRFLGQCGTGDSAEDFFQQLARYLAGALKMSFVCIDRLEEGHLSARTLAVFHNGQFEDNVSYTLKDTPCGDVVGQKVCCFPAKVRELFPMDEVLQDLQAESYLGVTLWSTMGEPIGLIAVIGRQPLADTRRGEMVLQLVAVRAASELERQMAEIALRKQEERLRFHLDNSPMAVVEWDKDFNVTLWTGESEQMFGWSAAEVIGRPITDLNMIYEADIPLVENTMAQLTDGVTQRVVSSNRNVTKQGEIRFCTWYNSVMYDNLGRMQSILSKVIDITGLKLAEMEKQKFISLVEHSDEFISICDLNLVPFYANQAALRLAGFDSMAEVVRVNVLDFFYPEDRSFMANEFFPKVLQDGHDEVEIRLRNFKTGLPIWMIYSVFFIRDIEGQPIALATVSRDISQRKLAEEELQQTRAELENKVVARTSELAALVETLLVEIEERQSAEAALEKSVREIEDLYNLAPCGYHSIDRDGLFVRINDTELTWLGYGRDEIVGKIRVADILTPESLAVFEQNFPRFTAGSQIGDLRLSFIRKDGSILPALLNASTILDENGNYLMSRSTIYDITELNLAEEKIRRLNQLYLTLSETGKAIARMVDRESLFEDICRIAVHCGGFRLAWIGLEDEASGLVSPVSSWGECTGYLDSIRISTRLEPEGMGPTGTAIREGGHYICNNFSIDPCTGPWRVKAEQCGFYASASLAITMHGVSIGALTIYAGVRDYFDEQMVDLLLQMQTDISFALENLEREERSREVEESLQKETLQRLKAVETLRQQEMMLLQQSRHAAMGEMIGNIAHQWRQPLNTLGLFTQRLGLFYDSPEFTREFLDTSVAKSMEIIQYMSRTIDDFRSFFSTDREKEEFRIAEVVNRAISLVEAGFKECRIRVEKDVPESVTMYGFPNEYAQVLLNILLNAKDVIIERNIASPRVSIHASNNNGISVVTIIDNAGGIAEEIMDKIFDPYFTTKGPQQGTGVGLFMSKTIIENNMGGKLSVRNAAEGAEFRIEV